MKFSLLLSALIVFTGCTVPGYQEDVLAERLDVAPGSLLATGGECSQRWLEFQSAVSREKVFEAQDWPLPEYPHLRIDRNLSLSAMQGLSADQQRRWLLIAYEQGRIARAIENQKLRRPLDLQPLEVCLRKTLPLLIDDEPFWEYVRATPRPDAYSRPRRWFGLFPLFQPVVNRQVRQLQEEASAQFQNYKSDQIWQVYQPNRRTSWGRVEEILHQETHVNELGLPTFSLEEAGDLFSYYSPTILQEQATAADRVGQPQLRDATWQVMSPVQVYTKLGAARWEGAWLPQLVYTWWYPERPARYPGDILAGQLDGMMLRITLDWHGRILFVDSAHPCGCYYKVFPVAEQISFLGLERGEEPLVILPVTMAEDVPHPQPPRVWLESGSHYIVNLSFGQRSTESESMTREPTTRLSSRPISYGFTGYDELRKAPAGEGYMFGPNSLVPHTQRGERFLLWNMGVLSPGAMRQWGNHAIALGSRRHFDEPELFARYFQWNYLDDDIGFEDEPEQAASGLEGTPDLSGVPSE